MKIIVDGTITGRFSGKKPNKSASPKSDWQFTGDPLTAANIVFEFPGAHLGPRTKSTNPYNYDPLLVHKTNLKSMGSVYSDRLLQWYPGEEIRAKMKVYFGEAGDYYSRRSPGAIEAFLRDVLTKPTLELTRIEEHCNQASGFPVWFFEYRAADEPVCSTPPLK